MPNSTSTPFNPTQLVQQATQALQTALSKPAEQAADQLRGLQPLLQAFAQAAQSLAANPHEGTQRSFHYYQQNLLLGANILESMLGQNPSSPPTNVIEPEKEDKRFNHPSWSQGYANLLKQSYLLASRYLLSTAQSAKGLSPEDQAKVEFYTQQFADALSPANFLLTNPEAQQAALESKGESLLNGFKNFVTDVQSGRISLTDESAFKVGHNIGVTPGHVVFRNHLIELIQYAPTTKQVHQKPLLICPPWINRYYILDLKPENSLVKFLVNQGYQVFMVSWKNPTPEYRNIGFENYITDGLYAAVDATLSITGEKSLNAVGYCIGGTMLGAALAIMQAKNDTRIATATFLTTLMDFANAGELKLFTDEAQLTALEKQMQRDGILSGRSMATTFSMLRANDLIWNFVVNNYLLGKTPMPFDLLYWNGDNTNMPCAMHSWYLRQLYLENNLIKPNKLTLLGTPVNLQSISIPIYMLTGVTDHITPWQACYSALSQMASNNKRLALTKAGHVAGVVSPPTPEGKPVKRSYWVAEVPAGGKAPTAEKWLEKAPQQPDSWWTDYALWLKPHSGKEVEAPKQQGNKAYPALCPAPGTYVLEH